ncbi:helix-turn-helix transcriptional regulator [Streptomyces sp. N2A]|uniref:helix-turn-helix domain-containing protein n=1 Tax=Streptomyces sp. N2A TaxID=3073936 RepID=UPI002870963B|nr:helix-turn-helix transcriptional regulator [Streptomyces sp. N2A]
MQRHFDPNLVDGIRRRARLDIKDVATAIGLSRSVVSDWLRGKTSPTPEKLPALAKALGRPIDELFPRLDEAQRPAPPDLRDLRCDAGIPMSAIPEIIRTATSVPVRKAEHGRKRLDPAYAERLADRYGVSMEELRAAEDRTFGLAPAADAPGPLKMPATLGEKIGHLLDDLPADDRPTDADIAAAINSRAGAALIDADQILALRRGAKTQEEILQQVPAQILYQGLADVLKVTPLTFQSREQLVGHVVEFVDFLAQQGDIVIQARGAEQHGISPRMLTKLNELLAEARKGAGRRGDNGK